MLMECPDFNRIHRKDKDGKLIETLSFKIHVKDKVFEYEYPAGSGNFYGADRKFIRSTAGNATIEEKTEKPTETLKTVKGK